jgi:diadenosine tetraphosphatase ApaH/serine/threonine PP2A family protein phosphatase
VRSQLTAEQLGWLRQQPPTLVSSDIFCCHGSPYSDETYLLEEVTSSGVFLRATSAIIEQVQGILQPIIVCGHSHVPRIVWLPSGQLVVNPGSVGIPAYDDNQPYPHVMEAGSPHARYAIISRSSQGWAVQQVALPYTWDIPAALAWQRGRPDRATWIETGRASIYRG